MHRITIFFRFIACSALLVFQFPNLIVAEESSFPDVAIDSKDRDGEYVLMDKVTNNYGLTFRSGEFTVNLSGYIKSDNFVDSRSVFGLREDWLSMFPAPPELDVHGKDINNRARFNMLAIETRLNVEIQGPDIGTAKASGVIEGDFSGPWVINNNQEIQVLTESAINSIVLRHGFVRIEMPGFCFLAGQYWHPLVPPESSGANPITYQSVPFEPYGFAPQLRFTFKPIDCLEIITVAASQLDYRSNGPEGFAAKYLRNAIVPNLHLQARFIASDDFIVGAGIDFKRLIPRLFTEQDGNLYKTREGVDAVSAVVYAKAVLNPITVHAKVTYASNLTDLLTLGGYGVTSRDSTTGHERYTAIASVLALLDIYAPGMIEPGILVGAVKNLGSHKRLYTDPTRTGNDRFIIFGRGGGLSGLPQELNAIDYVIGVSPRLRIHYEPVTIGIELEWLRASYGQLNNKAQVKNGKPVNNVRFIAAAYYNF